MEKSKQELLRMVDEYRRENDNDIFQLCRDCAEKIRHTDEYVVTKIYPDGLEP